MQLITERDLIRGVAKAWDEQYGTPTDPKYSETLVSQRLHELDTEKATAQDVAAIIGNDSWTTLRCHECGKDTTTILRLGEPPDYESNTADICPTCIRQAYQALSKSKRIQG